jgi:hypothetical protein
MGYLESRVSGVPRDSLLIFSNRYQAQKILLPFQLLTEA